MNTKEKKNTEVNVELLAQKQTFSVNEAMAFTGYSRIWLYKLVGRKDIPHYKRGKRIFFDRTELEMWMRGAKVSTNVELMQQAISTNAKGGK